MYKLPTYNRPFFYSNYYNEWSGNIPDIIAVEYGLKSLAILKTHLYAVLVQLKNICADKGINMGIEYVKRNHKYVLGTAQDNEFCVYLSRDNKTISWTKRLLKNFSKTFNKNLSFELGIKLGYPECCVRNYVENESGINYFFSNKINNIPLYNNNLLTGGTSNTFLLTHTLCSYRCKNSIKYAKRILDFLKKEEPTFFYFLYKNLKKPILVWINNLQFHHFLGTLIAISLNGIFNKDSINYQGFYISLPLYSEVKLTNCPTDIDFYYLSLGNKLTFDASNNSILIYNNNKLLHRIKMKKNLFIVNPHDDN